MAHQCSAFRSQARDRRVGFWRVVIFFAQYKMEAVVKGLLEVHPLPLGYLELFEPILLSRKSFSKLNGILEVGRKCEEIDNVEVSVR